MSTNQLFDRLLSAIAGIAVIAMMLHVVAHALMRYFFSSPIYGTNEIVEYWWLPAVALLGIPAAQMQKEHITVTLVLENMSDRTANVLRVFSSGLGIVLSLAFCYYGLMEALKNTRIGSTAGVTDIVTWPIYYLVPVVFLMLAALYVLDIVRIVRGETPGQAPAVEDEADVPSTEAKL